MNKSIVSIKGKGKRRMKNAREIAVWFVQNNSDIATSNRDGNIKLNKLLYYAQAMFLVVHEEALFSDRIEAWENGPVVKEIYSQYRYDNLANTVLEEKLDLTEDEKQVLKIINSVYGSKTANELVELSHSEEPWANLKSLVIARANPPIKRKIMKEFYKGLKDIYESYKDYDFSNEMVDRINGNNFIYNKKDVEFTEEEYDLLWSIGNDYCNKTFYVEKDDEGELVIY